MWFKNKKTGLEWEVTTEEHIKRLKCDPNYIEIEKKSASKSTAAKKKVE